MNQRVLIAILLGLAGLVLFFYFLGGMLGLVAVAGLFGCFIIVEWPLVGLALLIGCSTSFQVLGSAAVIGFPVSLTKLVSVPLFAGYFLWVIRRRGEQTFAPQMIPLTAFAAVVVFWVFLMPEVRASVTGISSFLLPLGLIYLFVANLAAERASLITTCAVLSAAVALGGVIGIVEYGLPQLAISESEYTAATALGAKVDTESSLAGSAFKRATGGMGDSTWFAYSLALTIPLNIFWWRQFPTLWARLLTLGVTLLQLTGLVLTFTRSGFIGVGAAALYLMGKRRIPVKLLAASAMVGILVAPLILPATFWERMFSKAYLREGSTPIRLDLVRTGWYMMLDKPLLGYGYDQFGAHVLRRLPQDPLYRAAPIAWLESEQEAINKGVKQPNEIGSHNLYVEIGVEYGLAGLLPFLVFFFVMLKDLATVERQGTPWQRDLAVCLTAGMIAYAVCGVFNHTKMLKTFWILAGLSAALYRVTLTPHSQQEDPPFSLAKVS